jgi:hypothetical protein
MTAVVISIAGITPVCWIFDISAPNRIVMNVFQLLTALGFIAQDVFLRGFRPIEGYEAHDYLCPGL